MPNRYRFATGDRWLEIDLISGNITCSDSSTTLLRPKPLQVLKILTERSGHIVTKDELFREAWTSELVVDGALRNAIADIRKAFAYLDTEIINTVPKRGYRLLLTPMPLISTAGAESKPTDRSPSAIRPAYVAIVATGALLIATLSWWWGQSTLLAGGTQAPTGGCLYLFGAETQGTVLPTPVDGPGKSDFSVSVWVYPKSDRGVILDQRIMSPKIMGWALAIYEKSVVFQIAAEDWENHTNGFKTVGLNQWSNIVVTVSRDRVGKIYVNGRTHHLFVPNGQDFNLSNEGELWVGARNDGQDSFDGQIDQVRLFDRSLDEEEVLSLYQSVSNLRCS